MFNAIKLKTVQRGDKVFDEIVLCGYDMHFHKQIVSERDLKLVRYMAADLNIEIEDYRESVT